MKIQIEHRISNKTLFEHDQENNTVKITLEIAISKKANLHGANLHGADLCRANLREADLHGANLYEADLHGANLYEANLYEANLYEADLREADLCRANLREADLHGANLYEADLREADLYGANLREANLYEANLYEANLYEANLCRANLCRADLKVKTPPIDDHYFISEILFRKAKTEQQKDFASRIRMELSRCWKYFVILAKKKKIYKWSKEILSQWKEFKETIQKYEKEKNDENRHKHPRL